MNFDLKIALKMNLRRIPKNHEAEEKGFPTKSISKPYGCATAMPTAWELTKKSSPNICDLFE